MKSSAIKETFKDSNSLLYAFTEYFWNLNDCSKDPVLVLSFRTFVSEIHLWHVIASLFYFQSGVSLPLAGNYYFKDRNKLDSQWL